jgi:hypothetical protein
LEEKKPEVQAKSNAAPINVNATNKVKEKGSEDYYDQSEDYSEFEAEDLEDNTGKGNNNMPSSNILANIPDLKTNDKDSDKL